MVRNLKISLAILLLLTLLPGTAAWASPAMDQLRSTVDEVIRVLASPDLKKPGMARQRRQMLKGVIDQRFNYEEMSKQSLGANWRSLSSSQRAEFISVFAELLERSYASKIESYTNEKVVYQSEKLDNGYAEIRTLIKRPNDQISVNYRLFDRGGKWWIYDVVIEGVSLISNYRSQFSRIIGESSYADLLRRMRAKLQETQSVEKL